MPDIVTGFFQKEAFIASLTKQSYKNVIRKKQKRSFRVKRKSLFMLKNKVCNYKNYYEKDNRDYIIDNLISLNETDKIVTNSCVITVLKRDKNFIYVEVFNKVNNSCDCFQYDPWLVKISKYPKYHIDLFGVEDFLNCGSHPVYYKTYNKTSRDNKENKRIKNKIIRNAKFYDEDEEVNMPHGGYYRKLWAKHNW